MEQGQAPGPAWGRVVQSDQGSVRGGRVDTSSDVFYLICGHLPWCLIGGENIKILVFDIWINS